MLAEAPARPSSVSKATERRALEWMLNELQSHQLVTILVPQKRHTNEGGCIRVNADVNCTWYRRFCAANSSQRGTRRGKQDTAIRRQHIIRALERMIAGEVSRSPWTGALRKIAAGIK